MSASTPPAQTKRKGSKAMSKENKEIVVSEEIVTIVDKFATKAEGETLKTIKAIAKSARAQGIGRVELSASIKAGLKDRASMLKPTHAQSIQTMALACDLEGAPQSVQAIATISEYARKAWGTEGANEYLAKLKGAKLADLIGSLEEDTQAKIKENNIENLFEVVRYLAKEEIEEGKEEKKSRKARPSEGASEGEGVEIDAEDIPLDAQVIALAVALTQYAKAEGRMTANLRKALDKLEIALADFNA